MTLGFNEYQDFTDTTDIYSDAIADLLEPIKDEYPDLYNQLFGLLQLFYAVLALGEAGEVQGKVKKILRDNKGIIGATEALGVANELGDLQYYVARAARHVDVGLEQIAGQNKSKLESRQERGVIGGSGDNR